MTFKRKVFLIIIGGMFAMVSAILVLSYFAYAVATKSLAGKEVLQIYDHARALLLKELDHLKMSNEDWSVWDDAYQYAALRNKQFENVNLQPSSFQALRLTTFSIHDSADRTVFRYPSDTDSLISSASFASMRAEALRSDHVARFLESEGKCYFVAVHSILKSDRSGPPRGTLVMTRAIDRGALSEITSILNSEITLERADGNAAFSKPHVEMLKDGMYEAFGFLDSESRDSTIILRVRPNKRTVPFDAAAFIGFIAIGIIIVLAVSVLVFFMLDRQLIRRIDRIGQELREIREAGRIDRRVTIDGDDEISHLGIVLNQTFDSLENSFAIIEQGKQNLERSFAERESLFREIRHRVKNNLQVVASLLSMQAAETEHTVLAEAFLNSQRRVLAMAFVHEELYCSDSLNAVGLREYLEHLAVFIKYEFDPESRINFSVDLADIQLSIERAVPFALIANEALTNSFVHAFKGEFALKSGERRIALSLKRNADGMCVFGVEDTGCGMGKGALKKGTLGLTLIAALSAQMKAQYIYEAVSDGGTAFRMTF